jgi:hypothetical protein
VKLHEHLNHIAARAETRKNGQDLRSQSEQDKILITMRTRCTKKSQGYGQIIMKKVAMILIAVIGFGISANAQTAEISGDPIVRVSDDGKSVVISVPVKVDFGTNVTDVLNCRATVKVCPKTRTPLDALHINCQWSESISIHKKYGKVTFSCSVKDSSIFQRCGAYDFEVSDVSFSYCY